MRPHDKLIVSLTFMKKTFTLSPFGIAFAAIPIMFILSGIIDPSGIGLLQYFDTIRHFKQVGDYCLALSHRTT